MPRLAATISILVCSLTVSSCGPGGASKQSAGYGRCSVGSSAFQTARALGDFTLWYSKRFGDYPFYEPDTGRPGVKPPTPPASAASFLAGGERYLVSNRILPEKYRRHDDAPQQAFLYKHGKWLYYPPYLYGKALLANRGRILEVYQQNLLFSSEGGAQAHMDFIRPKQAVPGFTTIDFSSRLHSVDDAAAQRRESQNPRGRSFIGMALRSGNVVLEFKIYGAQDMSINQAVALADRARRQLQRACSTPSK